MTLSIIPGDFHGIIIRIVTEDTAKPAIPLCDIARGIDYPPHKLADLYERNQELLKDDAQTTMMVTGNQVAPIPHLCLTREGVIGIMMKLDYKRIKNPEKKEKVLEFQKWAKKTLNEIMQVQTQLIQPTQAPQAFKWSGEAAEHMAFASNLHQAWGISKDQAFAIGLRSAQEATGIDLSMYRNALAPAMPYDSRSIHVIDKIQAQEPRQVPLEILPQALPRDQAPAKSTAGHITVTEIATLLNKEGTGAILKGEDINRFLCTTGYQYRDENKNYLLTEKGSLYGIVATGSFPSGHVGEYIKWKPDIIEISEMRKYKPARIRDS